MPVIDESALRTAQRLARLANTPEEQPFAQAAVQAANHELDLAFMGALHEIQAHPPVLSPEALKMQATIADAQQSLESDTEILDNLAQRMGKATEAEKPDLQDQLDLVGSRIEIEKDEIEEANDDLMAAGGNVHQRIQNAQEEHLAAERNTAPPAPVPTVSATALSSLHGMVAQVRQWLGLRGKRTALEEARSRGGRRRRETHRAASRRSRPTSPACSSSWRPLGGKTPRGRGAARKSAPSPAAGAGDASRRRQRSSASRASSPSTSAASWCAIKRITARHKLADVYRNWGDVVADQQREVLREWLAGAAVVVAALLLLLFADRSAHPSARARPQHRPAPVRHLAKRHRCRPAGRRGAADPVHADRPTGSARHHARPRRRRPHGRAEGLHHCLHRLVRAHGQERDSHRGLGGDQRSERRGESSSACFTPYCIETGNWTDAGHPTGRRVTFTNSFAIEGHYFNFSTTGQWLWDELTVVVPSGRDPQPIVNALQKEVTEATAENAREAEQEWQVASRGKRGTTLSAKPGIAVRPAVGGVEIAVRYVARASERYAMRARLYQAAVQLLAVKPAP